MTAAGLKTDAPNVGMVASVRGSVVDIRFDGHLPPIYSLLHAQEAQNSKAPAQLLADKAAQWLVIAAIVIGLATFAAWFWWIGESLLFAVTLTITVFVIACPDALGLATPMAVMVSTGLGALNGILFKNASALEDATKLNVIVFDKTGTLTIGQPKVAALSMSGSTLIVAINALMLKRTKLAGIRQPGKSAVPGTPELAATPTPGEAPAVSANA